MTIPVAKELMEALIARSGDKARVTSARSNDWQSLTFFGDRHEIDFAADEREPLEDMINGLGDVEIQLSGAILADLACGDISGGDGKPYVVRIDALTVDEAQ